MGTISPEPSVQRHGFPLCHRLFRFVRDPRYRLLYGGPWKSSDELAYELDGRLLTADLSAPPRISRSERHTRNTAALVKFWEEISPEWEWPDYVGNSLFALGGCVTGFWVSLHVAVLAPVGLFITYLILRCVIRWAGHEEYLKRLHWRLQCQIDP